MFTKITPKDIIAVLILVGIGFLKFTNNDGTLDTFAALIIGYYFGHRISGVDNGGRKPPAV